MRRKIHAHNLLQESCTVNAVCVGSTMTEMFSKASDEVKGAMAIFYPLTPLSGVREWDSEEAKSMGVKVSRALFPSLSRCCGDLRWRGCRRKLILVPRASGWKC